MHEDARDRRIDAYDPGGEYVADAPAHRLGWPDAGYEERNTGRQSDEVVGGDYRHSRADQPDIYDRHRERRTGAPRDEQRQDRQPGYGQRGGYNETAGPGDNRSSLYGHPGRGDYSAQRDYSSGFGSQSGYEFPQGHRGKAPRNYARSDERIREDLCERLTEAEHIDPSDVEVTVKDGVVTLTGTVEERWIKHSAEDMAEACSGVKDVINQLRVQARDESTGRSPGGS